MMGDEDEIMMILIVGNHHTTLIDLSLSLSICPSFLSMSIILLHIPAKPNREQIHSKNAIVLYCCVSLSLFYPVFFTDELKLFCKDYFDRMYICEGQKWDLEYEVRKRDWEVLPSSTTTTTKSHTISHTRPQTRNQAHLCNIKNHMPSIKIQLPNTKIDHFSKFSTI